MESEEISMEATKRPYALAREEGEELWFLGAPTRVIATAEQTGGAFRLIEHVIAPGGESPGTCTTPRTSPSTSSREG